MSYYVIVAEHEVTADGCTYEYMLELKSPLVFTSLETAITHCQLMKKDFELSEDAFVKTLEKVELL